MECCWWVVLEVRDGVMVCGIRDGVMLVGGVRDGVLLDGWC